MLAARSLNTACLLCCLRHTVTPCFLCCSSITTTANDRVYCKMLSHGAVHGAFAGFSGITVGLVNTHVSGWWSENSGNSPWVDAVHRSCAA